MKTPNLILSANMRSESSPMLRVARLFGFLGLLMLNIGSAFGFALLGPNNEAYQIPNNGFNPLFFDTLLSGPKNLGEEYRRNTPVMYYSFDANFLDFFGSNGVYAVDQCMTILNGLTNVSSYSKELNEFPLESQRFNFRAQELFIYDIKSSMLHYMMEQLGLAEPVRYTWILHDRAKIPIPPACPDAMFYAVVKRNFDPVPSPPDQYWSSSYVNGILFSYIIYEFCTGPPPLADALEFPVDPLANTYTAVADNGLELGGFYTSLTRDDVGGLRYLLRTNNMNFEHPPAGALQFVTNQNPQFVVSSNLALFEAQALTNNAATLAALYPNLVITATSNTLALVTNINVIPTITTAPWAPAGSFIISFQTNITVTPQVFFHHTFANVVTFKVVNGRWTAIPAPTIATLTNHNFITVQTIQATNAPWAPPGTFVFSAVNRTFLTNQVSGEFLILPTNLCDVAIISSLFTNVVSFTNTVVASNQFGLTNVGGVFFVQNTIDFFTNHFFAVLPVNCVETNSALFQGVERLRFIRRDFDSLLGRFFSPATNLYEMNEITNGVVVRRSILRPIAQPDFLFSAQDLVGGPDQYPLVDFLVLRNVNFGLDNIYPFLAGPGTIDPVTRIALTKVGQQFFNFRIDPIRFLDELTQSPVFAWGSFDGTTNAPIVYPNGESILDLENQVLIRISPDSLPAGKVGEEYTAQLSATGGAPPYTWQVAPDSNPLPDGLTLSSGGEFSGTPTAAGIFDFVIRMIDTGGTTIYKAYSIDIAP